MVTYNLHLVTAPCACVYVHLQCMYMHDVIPGRRDQLTYDTTVHIHSHKRWPHHHPWPHDHTPHRGRCCSPLDLLSYPPRLLHQLSRGPCRSSEANEQEFNITLDCCEHKHNLKLINVLENQTFLNVELKITCRQSRTRTQTQTPP